MKLSFETENGLFWQQWNQVYFPMELSPCLLPDLSLGRSLPSFWILRGSQGTGGFLVDVQWVNLCPFDGQGEHKEPAEVPHMLWVTSHTQACPCGWMSLQNVLLQDGAERTPCPGTTGCSLDRVCFYSTLSPLETPSAPHPLQPRCCNWDMAAWSCPPQQASLEKSSLFQQLKNK